MSEGQAEGTGWVERWYRVMLLGYPASYRERHGGELIGTLLEAYPSRRLPSARESAGLLDAGLLMRLRARCGAAPAWMAGLQLGVLLLALMQAGSQLAVQPAGPAAVTTLPPVLVVVAVLLGRMGAAAVAAAVQAALVTYQACVVNMGTVYSGEEMVSSKVVWLQAASGGGDCWVRLGVLEAWVIAVGAAVLAVTGTRGRLPRRTWWWLAVPPLQAAFAVCTRPLMPGWIPMWHQHATAPASLTALSVLPIVAAVGFLLVALRATVATGDPRWTIAAWVYLVPTGILAVALATTEPSAVLTLDGTLPAVLLAAACTVVLLRGTRSRTHR